MIITCDYCKKEFNRKPSQVKKREQHFCSRNCQKVGFVFSNELRAKIAASVSRVNTGIKRSPEACRNIALGKMGEKHPLWKGDSVGYKGLHCWISDNWGRSSLCEQCGTNNSKKFQWANLGIYNRERKNWKRMCASCHHKFDNLVNNFTKNKK